MMGIQGTTRGIAKKLGTSAMLLSISCVLIRGQDERLSQPWNVPLRYNPAMMALNTDLNIALQWRSQWKQIAGGFETYHLHAMAPAVFTSNGKLDVGISVVYDRAGAFQDIDPRLAIGYTMILDETRGFGLAVALMGGYLMRQVDVSGLLFGDQERLGQPDPAITTADVITSGKKGIPMVGAGVNFFGGSPSEEGWGIEGGFYADYLSQPDEAFGNVRQNSPLRYTAHIRVRAGFDYGLVIPELYVWKHGGSREVTTGVRFAYTADDYDVIAGIWYRFQNSFSFSVGGRFKFVYLQYSYDLPSGVFARTFTGVSTHEITLGVRLPRGFEIQSYVPKY